MISQEFLDEVLFKNDIVSVVSSYVNLRGKGRTMNGLCPFHDEKTPSFYVYPHTNSFYCFGCGIGGTPITFIQKLENFDFLDAVRFLSERCGLEMPKVEQKNSKLLSKEKILEVNKQAALFYNKFIYSKDADVALTYLKSRGLTDKTIRKFGIGFAPFSKNILVKHLKNFGFKKEIILKSGLGSPSFNGGLKDRFFGRIIFPIVDHRGNVVGFGARTIGNKKPKYLNTSDTLVFKKSNNLFSLNFAKKTKQDFFILTEGYMDSITVSSLGFDNVVATLGTALTKQQAYLISQYTSKVVVAYDADESGIKAATRSIEILKGSGLSVRILKINEGKDPDEFIRFHKDKAKYYFEKLIDEAKSDVEYRLAKLGENFDIKYPEQRVFYLKEAIKIFAGIKDQIEQEVWCAKLSLDMKIQKETLLNQLKKEIKKQSNFKQNYVENFRKINFQNNKTSRFEKAEEALLSYIVLHPDEIFCLIDKISYEDFCSEFNKRFFKILYSKIKKAKLENSLKIRLSDFISDFSVDEMGKVTKFFINANQKLINYDSVLECIETIKQEKEKISIKSLDNLDNIVIKKYINALKEKKR
ncbi:MAG: DNA primase [Oscillospiraceae bacterium]|jgi:DNA primase|nr:DNA primase [Oscillospiraceae bacterium]